MFLSPSSFHVDSSPTAPGTTTAVRLTVHYDLPTTALSAVRLDTLLGSVLALRLDSTGTPEPASAPPSTQPCAVGRGTDDWGVPQLATAAGWSREATLDEVRRQVSAGAGPLASARLRGRGARVPASAARTWLAERASAPVAAVVSSATPLAAPATPKRGVAPAVRERRPKSKAARRSR